MTSIIPNKDKKEKQRKTKRLPIVFWLMIWQAASVFVGQEILLASPAAVLKRLFTLVTEPFFWQSLLFSGARIGAGFLLGAAAGIAGAALAGRFSIAEELLTPLVAAVKAVPVASFVILILICVSDGISDPVYKHAERPTGTGHSAFGDDRRFSGSAAGAAALGDPAAAVPIYPDGMFTFPRPLLEGRNGSRSNRHSEPIHRRASVSGKNISRHTGTLCLDGSDRVRQLLSRKSCFKRNGSCGKKNAGDEMREDTIEICHLKKAYGEHVIFSNLTMELKKGAVTCLMAPSGAGKTTLLRILAGLEQADGGKIGGLEALRKSMVFQEPRLAEELTAAANIQLSVRRRMFGKEKRSSRHLVEEMEELGLSGCENQAVSELSGGMRQRVAVLRAMRMDADFLLLDEPFRGLDAGTKKKTMNYIRRKGKEKTMLLVTHDLEEAEAMGDWICTCSRLDGILEIKRNRKSSTEI